MRVPSPVLSKPREIMMAIPIIQISVLFRLLNASLAAWADGFLMGLPSAPISGTVTCNSATMVIASTAIAPMGMALPMMPAITPINSASRCHALGGDEPENEC